MISLNGYEIVPTIFPDKTSQVWKLPRKLLEELVHLDLNAGIVWEFEHEGEFMHLAQLKLLMNKMDRRCELYLPYLPYARQDKDVGNDATFALHSFCVLLNSLEFGAVNIMDPHNPAFCAKYIENFTPIYPIEQFCETFAATESDIICYPDKGALHKYTRLYYPNVEYIYGEKEREQATGKIISYALPDEGTVEGKKVLICDDLCDFGNTFILLTKRLLAQGAKEVNLFVTHGLFTGGLQVLKDAGITGIYTIDGLQNVEEQ